MELTRLDKAFNSLMPRYGEKRMRARANQERIVLGSKFMRKYDGASKGGRTSNWLRQSTGANAEVGSGLVTLRDSCHDLARNNPWAKRAGEVVANYVVGDGVKPEFQTSNKKQKEGYTKGWKAWAESIECDANGQMNFYGLQRLAWIAKDEGGGALLRRRKRHFEDGLSIPMQIQVLEADFIDLNKNEKIGLNTIIQGMEYTPIGEWIGSWLFETHPGEAISVGDRLGNASKFVPAEDLIYLTTITRPGQIHGVPAGHTTVNKLKDLDDANDNYLFRQKIAACYTAFIYDSNPEASSSGDIADTLEPGTVENLPPGKDIRFATPPGVEGFSQFHKDQLYAISTGFGITYEALTGDNSNVNFLSGRIGKIEMMKNITNSQNLVLIPLLCQGVLKWFKEAADLTQYGGGGELTAEWLLPSVAALDPQKELAVEKEKVRCGAPLYDFLKGIGYDNPQAAIERKAEENKELDRLNLILDTDPRYMSAAGNPVNLTDETKEGSDNAGSNKDKNAD
ncbi:MAG: phage portal protein [Gammaproteobacteria bacterium]|nr:MAG: phage portal protein [Gammaproteobacteria bacterium]